MSFFNGDVVAKEQLPGAVGSAYGIPVVPTIAGAFGAEIRIKRRRLTPRVLRLIQSWLRADLYGEAED